MVNGTCTIKKKKKGGCAHWNNKCEIGKALDELGVKIGRWRNSKVEMVFEVVVVCHNSPLL